MKREITPDDILPMEEYGKIRSERRRQVTDLKRRRRVEVGPFATFYFECFETMLHQVHEMLYIERGGERQIPGELEAYNPLVPKGRELVATVMFEIEDEDRRRRILSTLGGVEETATLTFAGETVKGVPEADVDRSTAEGKASSVQFIHFPFTLEQIEKFRRPNTQVVVGLSHPKYAHMAIMPEEVRATLAGDFE
jgi:hypothetical protein